MKDLSAYSSLSKLELDRILWWIFTFIHVHMNSSPQLLLCMYMIMSVNKHILFNSPLPCVLFLTCPRLRQHPQWDQWSWAMLQAHSSQPGVQQYLEAQRLGQTAAHISLPCRFFSITVRNMINRCAFIHRQCVQYVQSSTDLQICILCIKQKSRFSSSAIAWQYFHSICMALIHRRSFPSMYSIHKQELLELFFLVCILPHVPSILPVSVCLSFLFPLSSLYVSVFGQIFTFSKTLAPCSRINIWSNSRAFLSLSLSFCLCVCVCMRAHMRVLSFINVSSLSAAIGLAMSAPVCSFALGPAAGVWVSLDQVQHTYTHSHIPCLSSIRLIPSLTPFPHMLPP